MPSFPPVDPVTLPLGAFLAGLALLALVLGCAALAGERLTRALTPQLRGLDAVLAWSLWASAALIAVHLLPLALGVLSRDTVVLASLLVAGGAVWFARGRAARTAAPRDRGGHDRPDGDAGPGGPLSVRALAFGGVLLTIGAALALLRSQAGFPLVGTDALNFQIPVLARWMESGSLWQLDQFFPDYSNATYPHHGNLLLLAVVLPFDSAFLARLVPVPYAVLACAGAYACAREMGADRAWALLGAALLAAVPAFDKISLEGAQTDTPMLAFLAVGCLFLLRYRRTGARSDLLLAGLGLGLCFGTKWYAITTLAPLLAVWAAARLLVRVPPRRVIADAVVLCAAIGVVGGFWLVRNWVEAGNPVFPQPLLGLNAPRDIIRERASSSLADYTLPFDSHVWSTYLRPQFDDFIAAPGYLLALALVLVAGAAALRRARLALAVALAGLGILVVYWAMPYSAFGPKGAPVLAFASMRYGLPALVVGAVALAWAGSRLPFGARLGAALVTVLAVLAGVQAQYRPAQSASSIVAFTLAAAAAAWLGRWTWRRSRAGARGGVLGFAAAAVAVGFVAGAGLMRDRANERAYAGFDPTLAWIERHAPSGARVGIAGVWSVDSVSPVLPAFGPRLGNDVEYAGPFVDHMLRQERNPARFTARLRRARYDLVIVGRGTVPHGPVPEERWAQAAGYRPVVASRRLALLARAGS